MDGEMNVNSKGYKKSITKYMGILESSNPLSEQWKKAEDRFLIIMENLDSESRSYYLDVYNSIGAGR